ncbi:MAG: CoA transferase subunit A [bacterium]
MINKKYNSSLEAICDVKDGATIMFGGFGLAGIPQNLIRALYEKGVKALTVISNNPGSRLGDNEYGLAILFKAGRVKKYIGSYPTATRSFKELYDAGRVELELIPQGTLAERIRAQGAGIGGFYVKTGVGTLLAKDKEVRLINGEEYVFEEPLGADFAFIKAFRGDLYGNLVYRYTGANFNPLMAMAADITIAEVEELVEPGELDPNNIHTPGIFVDRILKGEYYDRWYE